MVSGCKDSQGGANGMWRYHIVILYVHCSPCY